VYPPARRAVVGLLAHEGPRAGLPLLGVAAAQAVATTLPVSPVAWPGAAALRVAVARRRAAA